MKAHETLPIVPIERGAGAWLFDFDGPALPRRREFLVGQPVRPRQSADQRRARRPARPRSSTRCWRASPTGRWSSCRSGSRRWRRPGSGTRSTASDGASATEIALKMAFHYWRNRGRAGQDAVRQPRGQLPRGDAGRAGGDRRGDLPRHLCAAAAAQRAGSRAPTRAGPRRGRRRATSPSAPPRGSRRTSPRTTRRPRR